MKRIILLFAFVACLGACKKDPAVIQPPITPTVTITSSVKLLSGAEGSLDPISIGTYTTPKGSTVTYTATPASNSIVASFMVDNVAQVSGTTTYTFTGTNKNHTVSVVFGLAPIPLLDSLNSLLYGKKWAVVADSLRAAGSSDPWKVNAYTGSAYITFQSGGVYEEHYTDGDVQRAGTYQWSADGKQINVTITNGGTAVLSTFILNVQQISNTGLTWIQTALIAGKSMDEKSVLKPL